jgi:drug/metabolite transporter (DMT)-like permease
LWGGSFIFMRIAAPAFGPVVLIELRVAIAALFLLGYTALIRKLPDFRANWRHYLVIGAANGALPFTLIATAELLLPASLASILNATTPLFTALFAALWMGEVFTARKVGGLALGFVGVVALIGLGPVPVTPAVIGSVGLSLAATVSYGVAAVYTKMKVPAGQSQALAAGTQLFAALILLPLVPFTLPHQTPPALAAWCALGLALLSTALAFLLFFYLLEQVGPVRATMVAYLVPAFGALWGFLFLRESLGVGSLLGFGLILASVAMVTAAPAGRVQERPAH